MADPSKKPLTPGTIRANGLGTRATMAHEIDKLTRFAEALRKTAETLQRQLDSIPQGATLD